MAEQGFFSGAMSPEETELAIDREILGKNPGAAEVIGGFLGKALRGGNYNTDPRMQKAQQIKTLKDQVTSRAKEMGIDAVSDPEKYSKLIFSTAIENNMPDMAFESIQLGRKLELERRKVEADEERNRLLDDYYKTIGKEKGKPKKKGVLPNSVDVKNILGILQGKEELAGMDSKQMANLSVRIAARVKELEAADPDQDFGDLFDIALGEQQSKIKPAKKRGLMDYEGERDWKDWADIINPIDSKAEYDDSGGPIKKENVPKNTQVKEVKKEVPKGKIRVKSPDGKGGTIDSKDWEYYKKQGFTKE